MGWTAARLTTSLVSEERDVDSVVHSLQAAMTLVFLEAIPAL